MTYQLFNQIENKWLQKLYAYIKNEFSKTWLPSHDETHHFRVWQYCKELTDQLLQRGYQFDKLKIEQLIIAVFFHDVGLTRTLDPAHGIESRNICWDFIKNYEDIKEDFINPVLNAIEKHDDKSYTNLMSASFKKNADLQPVLAISDDMDAFGPVGIFRYIEIYYQRQIPVYKIPFQIIENLNKRFSYFLWFCNGLGKFTQIHKNRYQYVKSFFTALDNQLRTRPYRHIMEGPMEVYNLIISKIQEKQIHFTELPSRYLNHLPEGFCKKYLYDLQEELNNFTC
jgi:hypothetical protein